jgi:hypothetical protein
VTLISEDRTILAKGNCFLNGRGFRMKESDQQPVLPCFRRQKAKVEAENGLIVWSDP